MRGETPVAARTVNQILFQSTPLMRGETMCHTNHRSRPRISIHSPHARGDVFQLAVLDLHGDFNPLPSCEGRPRLPERRDAGRYFNPLPSCEGRLERFSQPCVMLVFQSTPLMRGETSKTAMRSQKIGAISIHSPHARGDSINL